MTLYDQHGEKIRYLAVGVWNTVFSYALFWVAVKTLSGPLEAATQLDTTAVAVVLQWSCWVIAVVQSTVTMK
jgi:putative flippase GtrA